MPRGTVIVICLAVSVTFGRTARPDEDLRIKDPGLVADYDRAIVDYNEAIRLAPEEDKVLNDHMNFGTAQRIDLDKSGRVVIPEKLVKKGNLGREVTVVGIRDHVEIWNRSEWNAHEEDLENRRAEIAARARKSSKSAGSATVGGSAQ